MRGWKAVAFDQFVRYCKYYGVKLDQCDGNRCNDPHTKFVRCSQSICLPWRKLGRADIKVSKITANNTQSKKCHHRTLIKDNPVVGAKSCLNCGEQV